MSDLEEWAFPENLQPDAEDVDFELETALDAVVTVRAEIPEDAFTASILGTERVGKVLFRSGNQYRARGI